MARRRHPSSASSRDTHNAASPDFGAPSEPLYGSVMDLEPVTVIDIGQGSVTDGAIAAPGLDAGRVLAPGSLNLTPFASTIRPVTIVGVLPALPDALYPDGATVVLTTDKKLYRSTGSAWTAAVPAVDVTGQLTDAQLAAIAAAKITGQITETQITDLAISTPKLAAGAITTAKIAAGAVTAGEIGALAVTTAKLDAGAVTAAKIAAGTITADKLEANTLTAGQIAAGAITASEIAAGAITAAALEVGVLPTRNLLKNGGFRNGLTGWTAQTGGAPGRTTTMLASNDTLWTLRDGDADGWTSGGTLYGSSAQLYGTAPAAVYYEYLGQGSIPVTPGEYYSASGLLGVLRLTMARIMIIFRDTAGAGVGTVVSGVADLGLNGGSTRTGWNYLTINGALAPATAAYAVFYFQGQTPNASGTDWYLFCDQAWMGAGRTARPYDPQESSVMRSADGNVRIDSSGITVTNGKLTFADRFGVTGIDGYGFGPSWTKFISYGVYNGDFAAGIATDIPASVSGAADTVALYGASLSLNLPSWVVDTSGGVLIVEADAAASAGRALKTSATAVPQTNRVFQDVPVIPGESYSMIGMARATVTSGTATLRFYTSWRTSTHAIIGVRRISRTEIYSASVAAYRRVSAYIGTDSVGVGVPIAPANASYGRCEIEVVHETATGATAWISDLQIQRRPDQYRAIAGAALALTITFANLAGATVTVAEPGKYLVWGSVYFNMTTAGTGWMAAKLQVDDTDQSGWCVAQFPAATAGGTFTQCWAVTVLPGAAGVLQIQCRKQLDAGVGNAETVHSSLTVYQIEK